MTSKPFGLYCPTSKASEVLMPRWTIQILGELWEGSTRFNEIRRGLPGISPTLLTKRLKEMQENGLLERFEDPATGTIDYIRTEKAVELDPILQSMARWAQRHIEAEIALEERDADVLMWNLRRKIIVDKLPKRRNVLRFNFPDAKPPLSTFWMITKPGEPVEVCVHDPGFDVDLFVETEVPILTGIYLGRLNLERECVDGRFFMSGDSRLTKTVSRWLQLSSHSHVDGILTVPR
ncbi:helix-turn-helix domain-containing protein [Tateyamaria sp. Alg231-49]|uniref:winged helix-turn-helix transcriptional regulator n=1 Tax=Tateyamaria sp. Alg231-49 TaxID=1922219 RepID=UPI000D55861A|nr:helix-turn-helix domain-containing protein [Tateyamaria sp. Alg231-49]